MKVQVGDVKLYFDVAGAKRVPDGPTMVERPTIVLLHGGPGFDASIWANTMQTLSEWAQVVAYDHRGNGRSEAGPREKWTIEQWGDDVASFCDALGIEKPVVVGSSFGGFVALSYAGRHPEHPSKLVLDSTSARLVIERMFPVFERLGGPGAVQVAKRFWTDPSAENLLEYSQVCLPLYSRRDDAMQKMGEMVGRAVMNQDVLEHFITKVQPTYDQTGVLAKITCPTLVLSGDDDPVTPTTCSEEIAAGIDPKLVRLEHYAGGHAMFDEVPERACALLREFVES